MGAAPPIAAEFNTQRMQQFSLVAVGNFSTQLTPLRQFPANWPATFLLAERESVQVRETQTVLACLRVIDLHALSFL